MNHSRNRIVATWALVLAGAFVATSAGAWECVNYPSRRVEQFEKLARREIARCMRQTDRECPDARLSARLDAFAGRIGRNVLHRCPAVDVVAQLGATQRQLFCTSFGACGTKTITVSVGSGGVPHLRTTGGTTTAVASEQAVSTRGLRADAGWTGLAHGLQILEGASYTAELSSCDGGDTLCDLHGATAGTRFGAPSPLAAGGVTFCLAIDFMSDLAGTYDLATGALSEEAQIAIGVYLGEDSDRPCPACVPADGDPDLGEAGACVGGANAGASCHVEGLGDPSLGSVRGTSDDCGAGRTAITEFRSHASATTGTFDFAPLPDGPRCTAGNFIGQTCPCSTCNNLEAPACRSDADCPESGGAPGICGGRRCVSSSNAGAPCSGGAQCPGGACLGAGEPIAKNACIDAVCTPTGDGQGVCLEGPIDSHCAIARHRGCTADTDCPAGDSCIEENRSCSPDPIALAGTPDVPAGGLAHPTLVGAFCMSSAASAAVNAVAGFPGPVSYVWPTEVTLGE